jgi:two-component system, OmpR family, response regulator
MRILIVEDEPSLARQLRQTLESAGYAVDSAHDGEEGQFLGEPKAMMPSSSISDCLKSTG